MERDFAIKHLEAASERAAVLAYAADVLDLAEGQVAIALDAASQSDRADLLVHRVADKFKPGEEVDVRKLLTPREQDYIPAARVIVNLIHFGSDSNAERAVRRRAV